MEMHFCISLQTINIFYIQNLSGVWLHETLVLGASPEGIITHAATFNYSHQDP